MKNKDLLSSTVYDWEKLPRESCRHYISASEEDMESMLRSLPEFVHSARFIARF